MKLLAYDITLLSYYRPHWLWGVVEEKELHSPKGNFFQSTLRLIDDDGYRTSVEKKLDRYSGMHWLFRGLCWYLNINNYRHDAYEYSAYCSFQIFSSARHYMEKGSWHQNYSDIFRHMTISEERAKEVTDKTGDSISLPLYKRFYQNLVNQIQWRLPHDYRQLPITVIDYDEYLLYEAEKDIEAISKDRRLIEFWLLPKELKQQARERYEADDLINQTQADGWYRKACLQYHPDKSEHPREVFQEFSASYRMLKSKDFYSKSFLVDQRRQDILSLLFSIYRKAYNEREIEADPTWAVRNIRAEQELRQAQEQAAMAWEDAYQAVARAEQTTREAEQAEREADQATRELEQATLEVEQSAREAEASLAEAAQSWQDIKSTCQAIEKKMFGC